MPEGSIQSDIISYLKAIGAYAFKKPSDASTGAGIADIIALYKGVYIALEVKAPDGTLKPHQARNLRKIQARGGIGEAVRSVKRVQAIIKHIDGGGTPETWEHGIY
jgi:Holliday junction resolvase